MGYQSLTLLSFGLGFLFILFDALDFSLLILRSSNHLLDDIINDVLLYLFRFLGLVSLLRLLFLLLVLAFFLLESFELFKRRLQLIVKLKLDDVLFGLLLIDREVGDGWEQTSSLDDTRFYGLLVHLV